MQYSLNYSGGVRLKKGFSWRLDAMQSAVQMLIAEENVTVARSRSDDVTEEVVDEV